MVHVGRRVFARVLPTDLRKSFDTLSRLVEQDLGEDPLSGDAYLFINGRRNRAKVLIWDGAGLCIYMKRLEKNRFAAPWERASDGAVQMTASELALFLEGSRFVFLADLSPPEVRATRVATGVFPVR